MWIIWIQHTPFLDGKCTCHVTKNDLLCPSWLAKYKCLHWWHCRWWPHIWSSPYISRELFPRSSDANLTVNLTKSDFGRVTVNYFGHMVGQGNVVPVEAKVGAVQKFPKPSSRKDLRQFLGMVRYHWVMDAHPSLRVGLPFYFLGTNEVPLERACFGSRHGKSPSKKLLQTFVLARRGLIRDAQEFFNFKNQNICTDHWSFVYVPSDEVEAARQVKFTTKTVKGTMKLHSIKMQRKAFWTEIYHASVMAVSQTTLKRIVQMKHMRIKGCLLHQGRERNM